MILVIIRFDSDVSPIKMLVLPILSKHFYEVLDQFGLVLRVTKERRVTIKTIRSKQDHKEIDGKKITPRSNRHT